MTHKTLQILQWNLNCDISTLNSDLLPAALNPDLLGAAATIQLWQEHKAASLVGFVESVVCEGANNIQQQKESNIQPSE